MAVLNWFLCLVLVSLSHAIAKSSGEYCPYEYIEQPPNDLQCNPYQMAELTLECTVLIPSSQLNQEVVWFHKSSMPASGFNSESGTFMITRLDNTQANILVRQQRMLSDSPQVTSIRSQLQVSNLNDSYPVGAYYCRIQVDGVEVIPSDSIWLEPSDVYAHLGACSSQFALSKAESKCAVLGTIIPTTVSSASTMDTQTVSTVTSVDVSTTHQTGGSATDGQEDQGTESDVSDHIELILAISSLAIFGVLILFILVPILLCVCCRKRAKAKAKAKVTNCHPKIDDLKHVRPATTDHEQSTSITVTLEASDYLIPRPTYLPQVLPEQWIQRLIEQSQSYHSDTCARTSAFSHDYEDIEDTTTVDIYDMIDQPQMKRNAAYSTVKISENGWKETRLQLPEETAYYNTFISNQINYLHTDSHNNDESMSDTSDDLDSTIISTSES